MTFHSELTKAMRDGNMTVADVSRWFGVPYQTARGWALGAEPRGGLLAVKALHVALARLGRLVQGKKGFPLPRGNERIKIVEELRA